MTIPASARTLSGQEKEHANDAIQLERLIYLTPNLDSLTKSFVDRGFRVVRGTFDPLGVSSNYVWLPSGQIIELTTTYSRDSADWRVQAIRKYSTHIAGLRFRVRSVAKTFTSLTTPKTILQADSSATYPRLLPGEPRTPDYAFALRSPKPLDVVFVGSDSARTLPVYDSLPPNGLRRIMWLLLTVSDTTEALLRQTFEDLGLHRSHEGCCDYWVIGPPQNRTAIRFELPSTTFKGEGDWLSIEEGGIVFD
jgi:hypothetical protein